MAEVNPDKQILSHSAGDCKYHVRCAAIPRRYPQTQWTRMSRISQPAVSTAVTRGEQARKNCTFSIMGYRINEYTSALPACF